MRVNRLLAAFFVLTLAACGAAGETPLEDLFPRPDDLLQETRAVDTSEIEEETLDLAGEYVPEPGEFLYPCDNSNECHSGFCVPTANGGVCTTTCIEDCPPGWTCVQGPTDPDVIFICVPRFAHLCDPCNENSDCVTEGFETDALDLCVPSPDLNGSFCAAACGDAVPCPNGYTCETVEKGGTPYWQCLPDAQECSCSQLAIQNASSTTCEVGNEFGTCTGIRSCATGELSACDAGIPAEEICDDLDNDCDQFMDEGCNDDGDGFCDWEMQTIGQPAICGSGGDDCDDDDPDTFPGATELCDGKDNSCNGLIDEGHCDDGNPCTDDICNPTLPVDDPDKCSYVANTLPCDDGSECTTNDQCFEGSCQGGDMNCDDANPCTDDFCNPTSGCYSVNNTKPCVDDGNPCTTDVCGEGTCQNQPATGIGCNDGNPCTVGDTCQSGVCVQGGPKDCDDEEECSQDSCDPAQGCVNDFAALAGQPCKYVAIPIVCEVNGYCGTNGCVPQPTCQCPNCTLCICCGIIELCIIPAS